MGGGSCWCGGGGGGKGEGFMYQIAGGEIGSEEKITGGGNVERDWKKEEVRVEKRGGGGGGGGRGGGK